MKYLCALSILLLSGCASLSPNQVQPRGEFATISFQDSTTLFNRLMRQDSTAVAEVIHHPGTYNPPTLFALSYALMESGKSDDAVFWYCLGQLRARSDVNKSLDPSTKDGVNILITHFGPVIMPYALSDMAKLQSTVRKVVAGDREITRTYDPRWIALHGMDAFNRTTIRFEPKSRWNQIDEQSRREFLAGFESAAAALKKTR